MRQALVQAASLHGRLRLARLLEMPEEEFGRELRAFEESPGFRRLLAAGAVGRAPFPAAAFAARRFAGLRMREPGHGLGDLLAGDSSIVRLIRKAGRRAFEELFIRGEDLTDADRAAGSGLTPAEAGRLRAWLDRLYIRTEFDPRPAAPCEWYSCVAGVESSSSGPELRYFNRDVWKSRYRVDRRRAAELMSGMAPAERARAEACLRKAEFFNSRRTTLSRALEELIRAQAAFLRSGDPDLRQPLTQRSLAVALGVDPSGLNRLVSNKSVELPWGTEAPLAALMPSAKALAIGRLGELARAHPDWPDGMLGLELARRRQIQLSRRSVAQYRKDLGLGPSRGAAPRGRAAP